MDLIKLEVFSFLNIIKFNKYSEKGSVMKKIIYIFLIFCLGSTFSSCTHLFYYPSDQMYYEPKKLGLTPKEVAFDSEDGEKIHAWLFEAKQQPAKGTILFFHGNAENLTAHYVQLSWLPAEGYNYLIFDYPGYGRSSGHATEEGTIKAGYAALKWVHQYDPRPLIIYGQSLGGAIAQRVILDQKDQIPIRHTPLYHPA